MQAKKQLAVMREEGPLLAGMAAAMGDNDYGALKKALDRIDELGIEGRHADACSAARAKAEELQKARVKRCEHRCVPRPTSNARGQRQWG